MIKIDVISYDKLLKKTLRNPQNYFDNKVKLLNSKTNLFKKKRLICSLLLSNSKEIKRLNKRFRKKNKSTDVLSFPFYKKKELYEIIKREKEIYIGDIIINLDMLNRIKPVSNFKKNLNILWIHGLVHLFGYKHQRLKDYKSMNKLEKKYLQCLN